jgi:hypothetical protein
MRHGGILLFVCTLLIFAGGCVTTREITISATPEDALIAIDGQNQGVGPIAHKFEFHGDLEQHTVSATREGFKDQTVNLTRIFTENSLVLELKRQTTRRSTDHAPSAAAK